jgi:hypothetical protein
MYHDQWIRSLLMMLPDTPWPMRWPERPFIARHTTTFFAAPVATAIAACWIRPTAAPPP